MSGRAARDDVSFEDILRYVIARLRISEACARLRIERVLRAGLALRKIERTAEGRYRLVQSKPPGLACKIKEMRTDDDTTSADSTSSD